VNQVAQGSWDAAEARAAIDMNEEQCWVAVRQAGTVAEYSQQVAQRVISEAGEQLRLAQEVHTKEQSEVAAFCRGAALSECVAAPGVGRNVLA
jgi:hypothetical protein